MLFNSYQFIFVFLPVTIIVYFFLAKKRLVKLATFFLVISSLVFYAYWSLTYLPLLLLSVLFNFFLGRYIEKNRKRNILIFGIIVNLSLLCYFKYSGFFIEIINLIFGKSFYLPEVILPLGISFFTFTQTAYLVDAYRGETAEYSLVKYSLFATIFPHLIAGPILYHKEMIPQFSKLRNFVVDYKNIAVGLSIFTIGLFKKVVIADTMAPWAKLAFNHAHELTFIEAWCGALAYTFQLYFDFSGYSEMAVGLGLMFNFNLPINFNSPYKSTSIIDFWRRWHITLSKFLKNYLYIPLGGNRYGEFRKLYNLLITMLLGGLWHGAGWTFIIWGGLHGLYLITNHQWRKYGFNLPHVVNWMITFICVTIAWVFFRADSVGDALAILQAMCNLENIVLPSAGSYESVLGSFKVVGLKFNSMPHWQEGTKEIIWLAGCLFITLYFKNTQELLETFNLTWKWKIGIIVILLCSLIYINQGVSEFLYFQF